MLGLQWIFPAKMESTGLAETDEEERVSNSPVVIAQEDEEVAAAIAVAIQVLKGHKKQSQNLGALLEEGRGAWWRPGIQERPFIKR